jgi:opacity protein-like surface antigen
MKARAIALLLILLGSSIPARAGSGISLGPQVGFYKSKDADAARAMYGGALRLRLSDGLGVEGSINYRKEEYANGYVTVKSMPVMATGLLYVFPIVYGAIGAGWYNTKLEYEIPPTLFGSSTTVTNETQQNFGWHFGGGLELPLGKSAKLVGDIRYVFLNYEFKTIPGTGGMKSDFYVITAGLLFNL